MGSAGPSSLVRLFGYPCGCLPTRTHACSRVVRVLVVGLGVDRIVDARVYRIAHPLCVGVLLFVLAY